MNKKIALVTLIEASMILSEEDKLRLLDLVPGMNERQIESMGKFLATEREFVLEHENDIRAKVDESIAALDASQNDNTVFVGVGRPAQAGKPTN